MKYSSYSAPSGWDIVQSSSALSGCTFVLCQGHSTSHSDVIEVVYISWEAIIMYYVCTSMKASLPMWFNSLILYEALSP